MVANVLRSDDDNRMSLLYLERDRSSAGLRLISAQWDPLLLQPLLVLEVILHVGQDHVAGADVHVGSVGLLGPAEKTED